MKGLIQCSFVLVGVTDIWFLQYQVDSSLRKQPTFGDATTGSQTKLMMSEKQAQKFHTDDMSLPRSG